MNVTIHPPADDPAAPRGAAGPADLRPAGPGWLLTVSGPGDAASAFAPAIGLAVMRGASVRRLP